jgi:hypothetical protein
MSHGHFYLNLRPKIATPDANRRYYLKHRAQLLAAKRVRDAASAEARAAYQAAYYRRRKAAGLRGRTAPRPAEIRALDPSYPEIAKLERSVRAGLWKAQLAEMVAAAVGPDGQRRASSEDLRMATRLLFPGLGSQVGSDGSVSLHYPPLTAEQAARGFLPAEAFNRWHRAWEIAGEIAAELNAARASAGQLPDDERRRALKEAQRRASARRGRIARLREEAMVLVLVFKHFEAIATARAARPAARGGGAWSV